MLKVFYIHHKLYIIASLTYFCVLYSSETPPSTGMKYIATVIILSLAVLVLSEEKLQIEVLKSNECTRKSKNGDNLSMHYTGTLADGTKFDSSVDRGTPYEFTLGEGRVIVGWEQGLLGMCPGDKRRLTIPPDLGYGNQGAGGGRIPPGATLVFEVELMEIKNDEYNTNRSKANKAEVYGFLMVLVAFRFLYL